MTRTQIQLTQEQLNILRSKARRLNVSVAELVRRAVDAYVAAEIAPSFEERRRRALEAAGRFGSGKTDVGRRHDDYLADAYRE
ncbi:MAG TPA: ribbon-helix-helix protein, CopG family [Vicinamibacteria bacterium]|nr:ribbon-helix-helix protein, CopG family [Vicinamibacteria bacterium]